MTDEENDRAFEFLNKNPIAVERQNQFEPGSPKRMPVQHYLSTWEIAKIMVDFKNLPEENNQPKPNNDTMNERRKIFLKHFESLDDNDLEAMVSVITELESARRKHPKWPKDPIHEAAIVAEESGELIRASLQYNYEDGMNEEIEKEAIQTAAMAVRLLTGK